MGHVVLSEQPLPSTSLKQVETDSIHMLGFSCFIVLHARLMHLDSWLPSEEDALPRSFVLHIGGKALEELGILSLCHGSEDRGRSPASWVNCTQGKVVRKI